VCGSCEEGDGYAEGFEACEEVEGVRLVKMLNNLKMRGVMKEPTLNFERR
jgi:hypothetical protein